MLVVLGLDYVAPENVTTVTIPKYNNKVANARMFDRDSTVIFQAATLHAAIDKSGSCFIHHQSEIRSDGIYRKSSIRSQRLVFKDFYRQDTRSRGATYK